MLGISFLVPPTYTASTSFVPEVRSQGRLPAALAGLVSQFNISLGTDGSESPRFYADVAKSRKILDRLLLTRYADPRPTGGVADSITLLSILRPGGRNRGDSLERGAKKLSSLISVTVKTQTNIVTVSSESRYPDLAAAVANSLVTYLNEFNTQTRQSRARERRKFIEQRAAQGGGDLRDAEEALKRFYQAYRSWQQSPQLVFEEGRLRRQVEVRQELYLTLQREYETARIEEVNDTPVITVIDVANPPQRKSRPKRGVWTILALALGTISSTVWALGAEYLDHARSEHRSDYNQLLRSFLQRHKSVGCSIECAGREPLEKPRCPTRAEPQNWLSYDPERRPIDRGRSPSADLSEQSGEGLNSAAIFGGEHSHQPCRSRATTDHRACLRPRNRSRSWTCTIRHSFLGMGTRWLPKRLRLGPGPIDYKTRCGGDWHRR